MPEPQLGVMLTLDGMTKGKVYTTNDVVEALRGVAGDIAKKGFRNVDFTHDASGMQIQVRLNNLKETK